ncbi:hypothetical protein BST61_g4488 [Cercospora zeina]
MESLWYFLFMLLSDLESRRTADVLTKPESSASDERSPIAGAAPSGAPWILLDLFTFDGDDPDVVFISRVTCVHPTCIRGGTHGNYQDLLSTCSPRHGKAPFVISTSPASRYEPHREWSSGGEPKHLASVISLLRKAVYYP